MSATPPSYDRYQQWARDTNTTPAPPHFLRYAHMLVTDYTTTCHTPTTPDELRAVEEATFEQASHWHANRITPLNEHTQEPGQVIASTSLMGASITYADTTRERLTQREHASHTLCHAARFILHHAGLHPTTHPEVIG